MVRSFRIRSCNITTVLRHRFEKSKRIDRVFSKWEVGLWFKRDKIVGRKDFNHTKEWGNNLVNAYEIGINLILVKAWVCWSFNGMYFEEKKKEL